MKEIIEILVSSPLVWIIAISCIVRSFWQVNDKGLMTEKEYYHGLHTVIEELIKKER